MYLNLFLFSFVLMAKITSPTVAFTEPLTSPPRIHHPDTLAGLLEVAGTRKRIVAAWGVSARTYDTRKHSPATCTIGSYSNWPGCLRYLKMSYSSWYVVRRPLRR
jgi:hypothetical protein